MDNVLNYTPEEKKLEWQFQEYSFQLPEYVEQLLEIDNSMQISVIRARMDLILSNQIIPVYVIKDDEYKILILVKKNDNSYFLDFYCGIQKTIPKQEELNMINTWCENKKINLSNGMRL